MGFVLFCEALVVLVLCCVAGMVGYTAVFIYREKQSNSVYKDKDFFLMINDGPDLSKNVPPLKEGFSYFKPDEDVYLEVKHG